MAPSLATWLALDDAISAAQGSRFQAGRRDALGGGCINDAWRVADGEAVYFVKLNAAARESMFAAEAAGLDALAEANGARIPDVICTGSDAGASWLVLEFIALADQAAPGALLGEQLARQHRCSQTHFGWERDNTIGETPQPNGAMDDWVSFWRERRLGFQLELAVGRNTGYADRGHRLCQEIAGFFSAYRPVPSLLHGDLWGGNWSADEAGIPVLFDPAVYCGDREVDLAMSELFGGFPASFYDAYKRAWPLDAGYPQRRLLYNLYHILNHDHLFGGGYGRQAAGMIDQLLAELGPG